MTTRAHPTARPQVRSRPALLLLPLLLALVASVAAVALAVLPVDALTLTGGSSSGDASGIGSRSGSASGTTQHDGRVGEAWVGVDDEEHPAVTGLDPALRAAVRAAATDAAEDGVRFRVTSGWRSAAYQQHLLDQAVETHGSYDEARRWVSTPELSTHVTGEAVDIGPTDAAYWLVEHGAEHGLCQVYANEIWHHELLTTPGGTCPPMLPDDTASNRLPPEDG